MGSQYDAGKKINGSKRHESVNTDMRAQVLFEPEIALRNAALDVV